MTNTWRLPPGITDLPFAQATALNLLSSKLIQCYQQQGYQIVYPPMLEYQSSANADNKTFKTLDRTDGSMLCLRSDITPQVARIDAKYYPLDAKKPQPSAKYCYVENILSTVSDDFYVSRNPIQAGAEFYGNAEVEADLEVINLMLDTLKQVGFDDNIILSLGHLGIVNYLIEMLDLGEEKATALKTIIKNRSNTDFLAFFDNQPLNQDQQLLLDLFEFDGDIEMLEQAKLHYQSKPVVLVIIESLRQIAQALADKNINIQLDLAELKNQDYYTGLLFGCFHPDQPKALAQGGRYDGLNKLHGTERVRFATGFSLDLKFLTSLSI